MPVVLPRSGLDEERPRAALPALLVVLAGLALACGARPSRPRLVVLVVVDTLRADHLTQYGYARDTSRALDRFASHATLFADCHAPASWTTPSTASILTGLLPARHGADARGSALAADALTLAEVLRSGGWQTAGISFNHNVCVATQFDQGFERFRDHRGDGKEYPDVSEMLALATEWIESAQAERQFLYLQPMNVHGPYLVPAERADDLLGAPPTRDFRYSKGLMDRIMKEGRLDQRARVDAAYLASHRDQYDAAVRYTMDELGGWFAWLEREGLYDEALIVVTADHGEELYDHEGFGHGYTLHREVLHVPLLVKLPFQRASRRQEEWVSLVDLYPTLLEALGVEPVSGLDGRSLLPFLLGEPALERGPGRADPFLFETRWPERFVGTALVSFPWKLVRVESDYAGAEERTMLFHLEEDPAERDELAARHPELVRALADELAARLGSVALGRLGSAGVEARLDEGLLQALGY